MKTPLSAPFVAALQPYGALSRLEAAWLPPCCLLCAGPGWSGLDLCRACLSILPAMHRARDGLRACIGCGEDIPEPIDPMRRAAPPPAEQPAEALADEPADEPAFARSVRCGPCRQRIAPFDRLIAPWRFAAPIDTWVRSLKHDGSRAVARVFGAAIARTVVASASAGTPARRSLALPDSSPPLLIPVPMHARRLRARGFNQAEAIARWAGRDLGLRVEARAAVRVLDTGSLAERSRAERQLAIRGAFRVAAEVADRHVVLVDDVLTTGATASELARECHDTGAASVSLWVAARTCVAPDSSRDSTTGRAA